MVSNDVDTVNFLIGWGVGDRDFLERYGPWAVVTGASEGIGRAFAVELAARGAHLVLVARRADVLEQLASQLRREHGVRCEVHPADLVDLDAATSLFARTQALDVGLLVAAAGFGQSGPLLQGDGAIDAQMVAVNCTAVLSQCRHYGQRLTTRGRGGVVLLSSIVAFQGTPGSSNYAATKAYVQSLAEGLRGEWAASGVDVIAAAPGPVRSGFASRAGMTFGAALPPQTIARQTLRALGRRGTVRPGWLSKLLGWSLATAPRPPRVRIMGAVMAGMTGSPRPTTRRSAP